MLRAARRVAWQNQIAVRVGLIVGPAAHGIVMPAWQSELGLIVLGARAWSLGRGLEMTRARVKRVIAGARTRRRLRDGECRSVAVPATMPATAALSGRWTGAEVQSGCPHGVETAADS